MSYSFSKIEKLKSKKQIETLFKEGKSISAYPLRIIYTKTEFKDDVQIKTAVSVSKRNFKKAVDRNHIKRLLRETYRLNKAEVFNNFTTQYALMILYIGKDKPEFKTLNTTMKKLLEKFLSKVAE